MPNVRLMKFMNGYVLILIIAVAVMGRLLDTALGLSPSEAWLGAGAWTSYTAVGVYVASMCYLRKKGEVDGWF